MDVLAGSTDVTTYVVLRLAADGAEATGLTITNIDLQYTRSGAAPSAKVDATALAATDSAHGDNQAIEIDATDQPGLYRVDWPDAAFAAGVREVVLSVKCATCFTEHLRVNLTAQPANVTHFGSSPGTFSSGRPEVNASHIGGTAQTARDLGASVLLSSGTGTGQILLSSGKVVTPDDQKVDLNTIKTQTVTCAAGVTVLASVGTAATSTAQTGDGYAIVNSGTHGNAALKTLIDDLPTNSELATSQAAADDATLAAIAALNNISTAQVNAEVDQAIIDAALATAATLATVLADTNELKTDWVNGGRLDLLIDAIKAKTDSLTFTTPNVVDASASVTLTEENIDDIAQGVAESLGEDLGQEIADQVVLALSGNTVEVSAALSSNGGELTIRRGLSYPSPKIRWNQNGNTDWPDLDGKTILVVTDRGTTFTASGGGTDPDQHITLVLTSAQTTAIPLAPGDWEVQVWDPDTDGDALLELDVKVTVE